MASARKTCRRLTASSNVGLSLGLVARHCFVKACIQQAVSWEQQP